MTARPIGLAIPISDSPCRRDQALRESPTPPFRDLAFVFPPTPRYVCPRYRQGRRPGRGVRGCWRSRVRLCSRVRRGHRCVGRLRRRRGLLEDAVLSQSPWFQSGCDPGEVAAEDLLRHYAAKKARVEHLYALAAPG